MERVLQFSRKGPAGAKSVKALQRGLSVVGL